VFDVHVSLRTLLGTTSPAVRRNVLPSTIAATSCGERVSKDTGAGDIAFASVAIERLSGFVALPLLTLVGFALEPTLLDLDHIVDRARHRGGDGGRLVVISSSPPAPGSPALAKRQNWMRFIGAVHVGVDGSATSRAGPRVLVAAIAYQASCLVPSTAPSTRSASRCPRRCFACTSSGGAAAESLSRARSREGCSCCCSGRRRAHRREAIGRRAPRCRARGWRQ